LVTARRTRSFCYLVALLLMSQRIAVSQPAPSPASPPEPDPFCAVRAVAVPWDSLKNARASTITTDNVVIALHSELGSRIKAHVTMIGDSGVYDAAVPQVALYGKASQFNSPPLLVALPHATAVRYVYVDSYAIDGAAEQTCPSDPFDIEASLRWAPPAPPLPKSGVINITVTLKQPLPMRSCGKLFSDATVIRPYQPAGVPTTKRLTSEVETFIDSNGNVVKTTLYKSSGFPTADARAIDAAQRSKYAPAMLLCTPIVGRYLFRTDFEP